MRRVLVTGATTPLGARIVQRLLEAPDVEGVVCVGVEAPEAVPAFLRTGDSVYLHVDLTRSRNVRGLMFGPVFDYEVDAIVHTAIHRGAHAEGRNARMLNVGTTRTLLHLARQHPAVRHFVFRSSGELYRIRSSTPNLLREDVELDLSPGAPQWIRDRVEADLAVCARSNTDELRVVVLRCAEILADGVGSQLYDYLGSRVCLRPAGFDPMVNLLTVEDAARAFVLALRSGARGVFNIPGADTLPLSQVIARWDRADVVVPGPILGPLYRWRRRLRRTEFRWDLNALRFHFGHLLDGARAKRVLGYVPECRVDWPRA